MAPHHRNSRLFCLVPDLDTARAIARELSRTDLEAHHLRVVVRREMLVADLPVAGIREHSAILEAARRGIFMGSAGGAVTGLVAAIELPVNFSFACGLVIVGGIAGSAFGAWTAAMMGIEEPHSTIRPYQKAIESGQVLILIDVAKDQLEAVQKLIQDHHPDARTSVLRCK